MSDSCKKSDFVVDGLSRSSFPYRLTALASQLSVREKQNQGHNPDQMSESKHNVAPVFQPARFRFVCNVMSALAAAESSDDIFQYKEAANYRYRGVKKETVRE